MGEPLLHPLLPDFIRLGAGKGFKVCITTNGVLLPRVQDKLIEAGVYKVNISVHSFEEGSDGEYLDYVKGCFDFADEASSRGILTVLRLWNRGYDKGRNIDTLQLLREKFPSEWVENESGARIRHRLHLDFGDRFEWPDAELDEIGDRVFCHGLSDHFGILCDGRVVPCCLDREGDITLGNIFEDDIQKILGSERAEAIREGFKKKIASEELCKRCGYARRFKL